VPLTKPTAVALAAAWCVAWPVGTAAWAEDGSALEPSPAPEEVGLVERLLERSAANKATNDALRCYEGVYAQLGRRAGMDLDSGMDSTVPRSGRLTEFQAAELKRTGKCPYAIRLGDVSPLRDSLSNAGATRQMP